MRHKYTIQYDGINLEYTQYSIHTSMLLCIRKNRPYGRGSERSHNHSVSVTIQRSPSSFVSADLK